MPAVAAITRHTVRQFKKGPGKGSPNTLPEFTPSIQLPMKGSSVHGQSAYRENLRTEQGTLPRGMETNSDVSQHKR